MSSIVHANEWHEKRFVIHQFQFFKTNSRLIQTYFHINSKQVQHFSLYCRHFSAEWLKVLWSWSTVCSAPVWTWHTLRRSWCCGDSPFWRQQLGAQLTTWIASTTGNSCLETPWNALKRLEMPWDALRCLEMPWDALSHIENWERIGIRRTISKVSLQSRSCCLFGSETQIVKTRTFTQLPQNRNAKSPWDSLVGLMKTSAKGHEG